MSKHVFRKPDESGLRFLQAQLFQEAVELTKSKSVTKRERGIDILWTMSKHGGLCNKKTSYSFSSRKQMIKVLELPQGDK